MRKMCKLTIGLGREKYYLTWFSLANFINKEFLSGITCFEISKQICFLLNVQLKNKIETRQISQLKRKGRKVKKRDEKIYSTQIGLS